MDECMDVYVQYVCWKTLINMLLKELEVELVNQNNTQ